MPYRVPLLAALAGSPGLDLVVWAGRSISPALAAVEAAGVEVRDAPFRRYGPFLWQPASITAAREAEVVVLGWNTRSLDIPLALRTARRHATGSVLWGHGFGKTRPGLGDRIRLRTARRADAVLLYGPSTRRRMVDLGLPEDRTFSAPNAIDQSSIAAAAADWRGRPAALAEFRSREGLTGPVVLFLSRLEADKNPPLLVEAFAQLLRKRPDAALVFVGDGSARAATEAAVDRFGIRDRVRFAGATYDEAKIAPWALSASLLVHPGGIGLSLMHAFGYGLPVITTDRMELHGPEVEILDQGRNGLFFRHGDAADLAIRIESMLEDPARLATMSAEAFRTVDGPNGRNIPAMVSGFLAAIEAAAARCGHRAGIASDRASNR
jgi:glycosyltransferase involved in cell wall biosynthesis